MNSTETLNSFRDALITLKDGKNRFVSVDKAGYVSPLNADHCEQWTLKKLLRNITVEKCPVNKECIILKSVHGKYMKATWRGGFYVPAFKEANYMEATPIKARSAEGSNILFEVMIPGQSGCIRWFGERSENEVLSWNPVAGDIYSAFSAASGTKYITCCGFSHVALKEAPLSYECAFRVERLGNGKALIKPYFGGYLRYDSMSGEIRVDRGIKSDTVASTRNYLTFRYVMVDNDRVALMAENLKFVRQDGGTLKASCGKIESSCIFTVTEFSAERCAQY